MNSRMARFLTSFYSATWRERYGVDFQTFLEGHRFSVSVLLDVIVQALAQRFHSFSEIHMTGFQRSVALTAYAYLTTIAAGVNLYWITDDSPLISVMHTD